MPTLGLPDSPRKLVFRKLVSLFRNDPVLKRVVREWHVFDGTQTEDSAEFAEGELPAVRILPFGMGASLETPTTQNSPLGIRIEIATDGFNADDLIDLWGAVEAAIFTGDGSQSTLSALRSVWPQTNGVRLSTPAITPNPAGLPAGVMGATGTITVDMLIRK